MLDKQQDVLKDLSRSLTDRMSDWAHPNATITLKWESDPAKSVTVSNPFARVEAGDGVFSGTLGRQGHGFQRSYLLALLHELAVGDGEAGPTLLLACEEPELYQHPPQARHLAGVFDTLSKKKSQVVVCTHSPYFISGQGFPDVRMVRRLPGQQESEVAYATFDDLAKTLEAAGKPPVNAQGMRVKLNQALQPSVNEMFFSPVLVAVEGLEDVALITAHLTLTERSDEFRRLGCHIVPAEGKSRLPQLLAVAEHLKIPTFTVFDADADQCVIPEHADEDTKKKRESQRKQHETDNRAILHLCSAESEAPIPRDDLWLSKVVMWKTRIGDVVEADFGEDTFRAAKEAVRKAEKLSEKDLEKNTLFLGYVLEELCDQGKKSTSLERLCAAILDFAKAAKPS